MGGIMIHRVKRGVGLFAILAALTPSVAAAQNNRPSMSVGWQWLNIGQSECITRIRAAYANLGWTDIASGDKFAKAHKGDFGSYTVCAPAKDGDMEIDIFIAYGGNDPNGDIAQGERTKLQDEMKKSLR
jgi:hypothetical protein